MTSSVSIIMLWKCQLYSLHESHEWQEVVKLYKNSVQNILFWFCTDFDQFLANKVTESNIFLNNLFKIFFQISTELVKWQSRWIDRSTGFGTKQSSLSECRSRSLQSSTSSWEMSPLSKFLKTFHQTSTMNAMARKNRISFLDKCFSTSGSRRAVSFGSPKTCVILSL